MPSAGNPPSFREYWPLGMDEGETRLRTLGKAAGNRTSPSARGQAGWEAAFSTRRDATTRMEPGPRRAFTLWRRNAPENVTGRFRAFVVLFCFFFTAGSQAKGAGRVPRAGGPSAAAPVRRVQGGVSHLPEPPPASAKPVEQFPPGDRAESGREGRKRAASEQVCPFLPADVWPPQMMAGNKTAPSVRRQPGKTGRVRGEGCIPGCRGRGRLTHRGVPRGYKRAPHAEPRHRGGRGGGAAAGRPSGLGPLRRMAFFGCCSSF